MYSLNELPKGFRDKSVWTYEWPEGEQGLVLKAELQAYTRGEAKPSSIFLTGPAGVGKTHLLVSIYKILARFHHHGPGGVTVLFWRRMLEQYRNLVAEHEGWQTACAGAASSQFLLLDDLTVDAEFETRVFRTLVEEAYDSESCLFVTSNLSPSMVIEHVDFHAADRLKSMCKFIEISGASRRLHPNG